MSFFHRYEVDIVKNSSRVNELLNIFIYPWTKSVRTCEEVFKMRKFIVSVFAILYGSSVFAGDVAEKVNATANADSSEKTVVTEKSDITVEAEPKAQTADGKDKDVPSVENQMAELARELQKVDNETKNFASLREGNDISDSGMSSLDAKGEPKKLEDIKALKLNEVNASEFFRNPKAFTSCLEPGYWMEVPHATDGGWSASLLVTKETLLPIIEGRVDGISGVLVNQAILKSRALDDKAFVDTIKYAFEGLINYDEATKKDLESLKLCELTTYSEFLKENGLERFDRGDDLSDRPQVGIPVKYSEGRVIINSELLKKLLAKRLEVAQKVDEIRKTIQSISNDRDRMITPTMKEQVAMIKKLAEENAELNKKIEEGKALGSDYSEFETRLKENEEKLKTLELERGVRAAKMYEEDFDQRFLDQLDKVEDCFIRLSALDPSTISADELKAKKISKETREKIEELKILKKKNEELKQKIDAEKAKNKEVIAQLEEEKKKAEEELAKANQMPATISQRVGRRTQNVPNPQRQTAIDAATAKISEIETKIKDSGGSYTELETQYNANGARIKAYEDDKDVITAQRLLDKRR